MDEKDKKPPDFGASEAEIDAILQEFGDDPRRAIAALLHDLKRLCDGSDALVSHGYVRRRPRLVFAR